MLCISHQNLFSYTVHVHLVHSAAGFKEPFGMLIYIFYAVFYCAHYHCHHFGAYRRHVSVINYYLQCCLWALQLYITFACVKHCTLHGGKKPGERPQQSQMYCEMCGKS